MKNRRSRALSGLMLVLLLGLLLSACGSAEPTPTATAVPLLPTDTPMPTATPAPTDTPAPTATPVPTNTPEPTATPDITAGFVEFESAEGGYTLMYPETWFTDDFLGFTTLASSEELLESQEPGEEGGAAIVVAGDSAEFGGGDAIDGLNAIIGEFDIADDAEITEGPTATTINGQEAAIAVIEGTSDNGTPIFAYVVSVYKNDRVVIMISATPAETMAEFRAIFEAIGASIQVGEPTLSEVEVTTSEMPEPEGFLLYGDTVTGAVTEAGPSTWSFIGIEGERVDLIVAPLDTNLDVVVDIRDEAGASILGGELDESFGTEEVRGLTIPSSGEFFIILRGFDNSTGDYELTLVEGGTAGTEGQTFPSEGSLAYDEMVNSTVTEAGASVWEFRGSEGDIVNITVDPQGEDLDVVVDVLDDSGTSILPAGEVDDSFGLEEIRGIRLPSNGVYSIYTRGFADSVGDYRLRVSLAGSSSSEAGSISFGESVAGSVVSAEASLWEFFAEAGDYIDITVSPTDDDFDLVVDVLDPTGASLLDFPVDASVDTEFIRVLPLPDSGLYTIAVTGYEGSVGDYELYMSLSNGGLPGSIIFAADTLEEGDTEGHAFPFWAFSGEIVTIQVDPESAFDVVVEVYDDDTDELLDEVDFSTGFEELIFEVPEDGNYYFQVIGFEGSIGDYEVTLLGSEYVTFEVAYDDFAIGRLGSLGYIEYSFRPFAGETVIFSAETFDDIDLYLTISDENDNLLAEIDDNFSEEPEELAFTAAEDGIVYVRVGDFFEGEGQFFLSVDLE